jgi:hypothetical protein
MIVIRNSYGQLILAKSTIAPIGWWLRFPVGAGDFGAPLDALERKKRPLCGRPSLL